LETNPLIPPLLAGIATAFALHFMLARARLPLDRPNERSLHSSPIPRSGGFAVVPAILLAWLLVEPQAPWPLVAGVGAVFLVSLVDDLRGLSVGLRLACHLIASFFVVIAVLGTSLGPIALAIAVVSIVWVTNLFNFMDGSDGLAGGMALIGFGSYGLGAWISADLGFASVCFTVAAAAAAFLVYNFQPARVFLGDCGSIPLGLLAGTLGLFGWARSLWPLWFPVVVFSPFIADASVTLVRRLARKERVWQAHREHYYQRLIRSGWSHRRTALTEYVLMLACGVIAMSGMDLDSKVQAVLVSGVVLVYLILMLLVDRVWGRHNRVFPRPAQQRDG
jgi:UDP-N-acetylmuramyl pentapeptide phosphotransferase/UDP-N-acetylglucosamine-1-phosphate transferase